MNRSNRMNKIPPLLKKSRTLFLNFKGVLFLCLGMGLMFLTSCASGKLWMNATLPAVENALPGTPSFTIYAIGDAGLDNAQSRAVLDALASQAADDTHPGMVIFLGDNIYPAGLASPVDQVDYERGKHLLQAQLEALDEYKGQIVFIPGNHDWNEFKPGGLEAIRRQGAFLREYQDHRARMYPENGCGGPVLLPLGSEAVMIIIDSQWWIQKWDKEAGINEGCPYSTREAVQAQLHQLIRENQDKQIVLALHHPIMTQGHHGGHFTLRDHLFPLTKVVKWLWLPLPVLGSIYPGYRSIIGHPQDLKHPGYRALRDAILGPLSYEGDLLILSGHDHNLQYLTREGVHLLLSGGGAKQNHVANHKELMYGHKAAGFMQVDIFTNGDVQLTVFELNDDFTSSKIVLRKRIISGGMP